MPATGCTTIVSMISSPTCALSCGAEGRATFLRTIATGGLPAALNRRKRLMSTRRLEGDRMSTAPAFDAATFRRVLGHYPTGVCIVTAMEAGETPAGMAVGSFTSVSLDPPLVAFFPDKRSSSWPRIERAGKFCVNVLAADQTEICQRFSKSGIDKFAGITH